MKGLLKFITCGSVDDGKSTLIGHILYDSKLLYTDQKEALELESKVGSRAGEIDYSLLLDGLMAEREQGITIDVAYRYFTTDNRSFIVADTPGHEEYTRNMAVGASFAKLAIILIDATRGVLIQTRRHARICSLMGIRHFVFAINKMDLVNYRQDVFDKISLEINVLSNELSLQNIYIIPLSATVGDNITTKSDKTPWFKEKTLLAYLEEVDVDEDISEQGFYMPIQRVCRPDHTFRGFQGQIESGEIAVGDSVTALPSGERAFVKNILILDKEVKLAKRGYPVTICLDKEVDVSRGCILISKTNIGIFRELEVSLLWMDDISLQPGSEFFIKLGTKLTVGTVASIHYSVDINTGMQNKVEFLSKNEIARCRIVISEPMAADKFTLHKTLGELILIDRITNKTSACGVVEELLENITIIRASFENGEIRARGDIFEEFFYDISSLSIQKYHPISRTYKLGDEIPVRGESYQYPESFDILVLRDKVVVKIRNNIIIAIDSFSDYNFSGEKLINGRGFEILASSKGQVNQFFTEYELLDGSNENEFFNKWLKFDTYRKIGFAG